MPEMSNYGLHNLASQISVYSKRPTRKSVHVITYSVTVIRRPEQTHIGNVRVHSAAMRISFLSTIASVIVLSAGVLSYAQQTPSDKQPPAAQQERDRSQDEGTPVTLRGCLSKGDQAQQYIIADETSGEKVSFGGPAKLDAYVNQTVEIQGQVVERAGSKVFRAQSVKSVSDSCSSQKK